MYRYLLLILVFALCFFAAKAQRPDTIAVKSKKDSLNRAHDSVTSKPFKPRITEEKIYHPDSTHSPHKAVIRSLALPGLGQIYNRQWWKLPLVYGVIGFLGGNIVVQNKSYNEYLTLSKYREKGITPTPSQPYYNEYNYYQSLPSQDLYDATDIYRRNRDVSILGLIAAWGVQTIDAYIAAKFIHSYTMDNNLAFKIEPSIMNQPLYAFNNSSVSYFPSIKITFTLK
jgi:hypothetical protein